MNRAERRMQAKLNRQDKTKKPLCIVPLEELMKPGASLEKFAKLHNAKDFMLAGSVTMHTGEKVLYHVMISETISEGQARSLVSAYHPIAIKEYSDHTMVSAWIPLNDIKELVLCDCDKPQGEHLNRLMLDMLIQTGANDYIRKYTPASQKLFLLKTLQEVA